MTRYRIMSDEQQATQNFTKAGVTGKVPHVHRGGRRTMRKGAKLSGSRKHHVGQLMKSGVISPAAASKQGISR